MHWLVTRPKHWPRVAMPTSPSRSVHARYSPRCASFCHHSRQGFASTMHNPPRTLIVDDNETNRDILLTRLGTHGYDLVQAADGEEAIEVARKSLPDLILLDVMMPKLDGIEATKRLKADQTLPFMPIILV